MIQKGIIYTYTLYLKDGKRVVIYGLTYADALQQSGYANTFEASKIAFHRIGNDDSFGWNPTSKDWEMHDAHYYGYQ